MGDAVDDFDTGSHLWKWSACLYAVPHLPLINIGDDIGHLIYSGATDDGFDFRDRDIVVVTHKIVSKAEGALTNLTDVEPSSYALELAASTGRDPRLCELYVRESQEVLGTKGRMVITRHRLGFICTNAGIDRSNVDQGWVVLLPTDPDASARGIRQIIKNRAGKDVAVIIADSLGKPDREGAIGGAIGIAGIRHLEQNNTHDLFGKETTPWINLVDELAGAACMIMGEAGERLPVVIVRGIPYTRDDSADIRHLLG